MAYCSKKLNGVALNYPTYDRELYLVIRVLKMWKHYLHLKEFIIHIGHKSLNHLKSQGKLSTRHIRQVSFINTFRHVFKYKKGVDSVVTSTLLHYYTLVSSLKARLIRFEHIRKLNVKDEDFGEVFKLISKTTHEKYFQREGFLSCVENLYMLKCSLHELLVRLGHNSGSMCHQGVTKIISILQGHFIGHT